MYYIGHRDDQLLTVCVSALLQDPGHSTRTHTDSSTHMLVSPDSPIPPYFLSAENTRLVTGLVDIGSVHSHSHSPSDDNTQGSGEGSENDSEPSVNRYFTLREDTPSPDDSPNNPILDNPNSPNHANQPGSLDVPESQYEHEMSPVMRRDRSGGSENDGPGRPVQVAGRMWSAVANTAKALGPHP